MWFFKEENSLAMHLNGGPSLIHCPKRHFTRLLSVLGRNPCLQTYFATAPCMDFVKMTLAFEILEGQFLHLMGEHWGTWLQVPLWHVTVDSAFVSCLGLQMTFTEPPWGINSSALKFSTLPLWMEGILQPARHFGITWDHSPLSSHFA